MRRPVAVLLIAGVIGIGLATIPITARRAEAWKPPTHLFGTEEALTDALDGTVTIPLADGSSSTSIPVNPTILEALTEFPKAYRAGSVGPDAFPDLLFGQSQIHPDTKTRNSTRPPVTPDTSQSFEWLRHLWEQAWDPARPHDERLQNIAFALGFMGGHANGDVWAHTWVNKYAEGVFPDFTSLAESDISVRHLVIEGYVDKHRPGFEEDQAEGVVPFPIDVPEDFVGDTLILSDFAKARSSSPVYDFFFGLQDGLATVKAGLKVDNTTQDFIGECPLCIPDPTDSPLNLIEWGLDVLIAQYVENWIEDIDRGLRDWVGVWESVAQGLLTGQKPDGEAVLAEFEEWTKLDLLSMLGLPDFVGEGLFLVDEIVAFIGGLLEDVLRFTYEEAKKVPVLGELLGTVEPLVDEVKDVVLDAIGEIVDRVAGVFVTHALGFTDLNPATFNAIDKDDDGTVTPREVIRVLGEPEEYIEDPALFKPGTRAIVDAEMGLALGADEDGDPENDVPESFRDYDPTAFAPLYDTIVMAKLAMLDEDGLNAFFKARAGGNAAALGDLYGPHVNQSGSWPVPNNIMTGWAKSLDAEYQWRVNSPNPAEEGRSYGLGTLPMFEDCVARERVFRPTFKRPVLRYGTVDIDAFGDEGDPPSPISDAIAPASTLTLSGRAVVTGGQTFVTGDTQVVIQSTDNYHDKPDLRVFVRVAPASGSVPPYGAGIAADPSPFPLPDTGGAWNVQFFAVDGKGVCNVEAEQTRSLNLDARPPVITVLSPAPAGAQFSSDAVLRLDFTADDGAGSGVDPTTARQFVDGVRQAGPPGSIDLFDFPAGGHAYRAEQADLLGNLRSQEHSWTTIVTADSLQRNVERALERGCVTRESTARSLAAKVSQAGAADARGNDRASDNVLEAFKHEIAAQVGKTITEKCAGILTMNAAALQEA